MKIMKVDRNEGTASRDEVVTMQGRELVSMMQYDN